VHALEPGRGAHVTDGVTDDEVAWLDQLDAHLPGQKGIFEVGRVERTGSPEHDRGMALGRRGHGSQRVQEQTRIVVDGPHPVSGEQLGHQAGHGYAVLEHVGDSRGGAHVVLEHPPGAVTVTDQVTAAHVGVDAARGPHALHGAGEAGPAHDQRPGDDPGPDDLVGVVDVIDEGVQRADSLGQAALDGRPLGGGEDTRHQVQRPGPISTLTVRARHFEGDPLLHENRVASLPGRPQGLGAEPLQRGQKRCGVGAWLAVGG
jgi:hypothetical protein